MALTLGDNFSYQGAKPLDARLKYETVESMKAVADATMYDGCIAYCTEADKIYQWKSANTVDETLGKWREYNSGGGSLSDLSDTDLSDPSDGDILAYDSVKEKWVNGSAGSVTIVHTYIPDLRPNYMESFAGSNKFGVTEPVNVISGTMPNDTVIDDQLIVSIGGVMIRKSSVSQPETETDGELLADISILSGRSFSIEDPNVIDGTTYYYSAFPYSLEERKYSRNSVNARISVEAGTATRVDNLSYETAYNIAKIYGTEGYTYYNYKRSGQDQYRSTSIEARENRQLAWNQNMTRTLNSIFTGNVIELANSVHTANIIADGLLVYCGSSTLSDSNVNNFNNLINNAGDTWSVILVKSGDTIILDDEVATWWTEFY